ncbi:helix-turn-helix domain-containing protein [Streptomyces ipomoeae]|uniref:helix-turn-helix domain-containing protein n=1 Tax=Streptomyces ipomoeae TaxID=103232 RepID=UPI00114798B4|nr:helix-turn-helix domain-containing protein [Streptomyces ipomoeae]MDX2933384.1 helix-turn-helix domain-containing protein [Streptomyces ipomoeae]TQE20338.1 peptidoglycan-binding protein [Streptomyces ipomoeae]
MSECTESERFAACLRSLKERSGLSYAALAAKTGTSGSSVHRYCLGTSVPQDYGTVHRLAVACGAAPEELRTLHRLWALADAARDQEPTELERQGPEPADEPSAQEAGLPEPVAPGVEHGAGGETAEVPREPSQVSGAMGRSRRRMRVGMAVGMAVLVLGGMAWTLPSLTSADDKAGGRGEGTGDQRKEDDRLLFTSACREVVAMGQHDACVREVQRLLDAKGAVIGVDGDFGPQTLRRVTAFQVIAGIEPPNGVVGDATKEALYESGARMDTWSQDKVRRRIREVFTEAPDRAVAIADCQSFLDPLHILPNTNGTRNWGLFQISDARLKDLGGTPRKALDPEWNILAAKRLWSRDEDFHDWSHCDRAFSPSPSASPSASPSGSPSAKPSGFAGR